MIDKTQAIGKISSQKAFLKDKYFLKEIGIFGSVVKDEQKPGSDIDVLVEFSSPIGIFDFIRLEGYLSKLLGTKVDLVTKAGLKSAIKNEVLNQAIYT